MGHSHLNELERECVRMLGRLRQLEEISVPTAAKILKKRREWVRANFPTIIHGPKSHHVKLADIEAYRQRRTIQPQNGDKVT
jgi:hypothetical protein